MNETSKSGTLYREPTAGAEHVGAGAQASDEQAVLQEQPSTLLGDFDLEVEAVLMTTDHPQSAAQLAELLGGKTTKEVQDAIERLNEVYAQTHRSFRIEQVAKGWHIYTLSRFSELLETVHKSRVSTKLSPAAMETLAIISYKQPILRADIEAVRGVASGEVIRGLMERHLVKIVGRAEELGRPMLYGTTKAFLELFGLGGLKDLPQPEEVHQKKPDDSSVG